MPSLLKMLSVAALFGLLTACTGFTKPPQAGSTFKVLANGGHGSGVHIGDRFVLTAAHVVTTADVVTLKADDGSVRQATVLWVNKDYDVALLRYDRDENIAMSTLACREAKAGETLLARGNPGSLEFVSTHGKVSGSARKHGPWASVLVFDGTVAPGMSGGPTFDIAGRVVGLTVGLMAIPMGFNAALAPISYVVPSSAVCTLLARG